MFYFLVVFTVVSQSYVTEGENEYVIRGNSAILKCKIPSFVADFIAVESWVSNEGEIFTVADSSNNFGKFRMYCLRMKVSFASWAWC